jgi:hypothetical protein
VFERSVGRASVIEENSEEKAIEEGLALREIRNISWIDGNVAN